MYAILKPSNTNILVSTTETFGGVLEQFVEAGCVGGPVVSSGNLSACYVHPPRLANRRAFDRLKDGQTLRLSAAQQEAIIGLFPKEPKPKVDLSVPFRAVLPITSSSSLGAVFMIARQSDVSRADFQGFIRTIGLRIKGRVLRAEVDEVAYHVALVDKNPAAVRLEGVPELEGWSLSQLWDKFHLYQKLRQMEGPAEATSVVDTSLRISFLPHGDLTYAVVNRDHVILSEVEDFLREEAACDLLVENWFLGTNRRSNHHYASMPIQPEGDLPKLPPAHGLEGLNEKSAKSRSRVNQNPSTLEELEKSKKRKRTASSIDSRGIRNLRQAVKEKLAEQLPELPPNDLKKILKAETPEELLSRTVEVLAALIHLAE